MKTLGKLLILCATVSLGACASTGGAKTGTAAAPAAAGPVTIGADGSIAIADPVGDDKGPGTYVYPTDAVYKPGSFDLTEFKVVPGDTETEFHVTVNSRIEDPWDSKAWGGNGFSVQMAFIHLDTDHAAGSGVQDGMPGLNVRFAADEAWDRCILISPQGPTRVNSEIDQKAAQWKDKIVVPKITRASGRTLIAVVDTAQLGGKPSPKWGYQVLLQSNEGFPAKTDLLTRKVNEYEGQHRFGGGTDYENDPHVLDLMVAADDATAAQYALLAKYNKEAQEPKPEDLAVVPMFYPQK